MSNMKEKVGIDGKLRVGAGFNSCLDESVALGRAFAIIQHHRPKDWKKNPKTGLLEPDYRWKEGSNGVVLDMDCMELLSEDESWNLITNVGRIQLHKAGYDTTGLPTNGFNYIALSNDTVTENAASTTLSSEIVSNGLQRAQGTVTLPTGAGNQTTIQKLFTATGTQSAQKAALFDASSVGDMNHVLGFTQRALITNDTLNVTYTITLG